MEIVLIGIAALVIASAVTVIRVTARDGYRRIPDRFA